MKTVMKYLVVSLLFGTTMVFPAMEDENVIDERLVSPVYDALMVGKQRSLQEILRKMQVAIKNLYIMYEDGGRSDESLKSRIIQLTSQYLVLKKKS